jgi:sugar O-acyltransferase (sialic acid O-acetyltransferase NeuD family)
MKKPILIYGAGGLGREILSLLRNLEDWEVKGFIDDRVPGSKVISGVNVLGGREVLPALSDAVHLVVAIGDPLIKAGVIQQLHFPNLHFPTLIHPSAIIQDPDSVRIGEGTIVAAGAILTTDIKLGNHVLLNLNATIGHDVTIGNFSSIMPGVNVAGEVTIGQSVLIGAGASIFNRIAIGDKSKVGMGAVVIKDVAALQTVIGVPAKPVNHG